MGEVTRVQMNPTTGEAEVGKTVSTGYYGATPEDVAAAQAARSNPSAHKFSSQGRDLSTRQSNSAPAADEARTSFGSPVGSRALRDDDRVMVGGVEVRVKEARRMGLVEEGAVGTDPFARGA
jgi:hypothetical protein